MYKTVLSLTQKTLPAWIVLWTGIIFSLVVTFQIYKATYEDAIKQFSFASDQLALEINDKLEAASLILQGGNALFMATDSVSKEDWHDYVQALNLPTKLPGLLGVGFNAFVPKDKRNMHLVKMHEEGFLDYTIHPQGERDTYAPVVYIEPFTTNNLYAHGYDTFSEPIRKVAMEQARDTGEPALTGKLFLIQDKNVTTPPASVILYKAIYAPEYLTLTVEQRRHALRGWISIPLRVADLMNHILGEWQNHSEHNIHITIYDALEPNPKAILFDNKPDAQTPMTSFHQKRLISFYNHYWVVTFEPINTSLPQAYLKAGFVLCTGFLLSILLFVLMVTIINTKRNAKYLAYKLTEKLRKSETLLKQNETFLKNLIHTIPDLIWLKDKDGKYLTCNSRFENFFGAKTNEIIGKTDYDFVSYELAELFRQNDLEAIMAGLPHMNEEWVTFANDGHKELLEKTKIPLFHEDGTLLGVLGIGHNITEQKEQEQQIKTLVEEQKAILDSPVTGIIKLKNRKFIWVNEGFLLTHGYTKEELIGQSTRILYPTEQYFIDFGKQAYSQLELGKTFHSELQELHKDGSLKWFKISGRKVSPESDESIWSFVDITEQKIMEQKVQHLAFYDELTGLPNRRLLDDRLTMALAKSTRSGLYGALMFIDLDNFKPINDTYGHPVGDKLLSRAAKRLLKCVRDVDTVARFGGDEFIVLINDLHVDPLISTQLVEKIGDKIRQALSKPYQMTIQTDSHEKLKIKHQCTASIGVVLFQDHKSKKDDIIKWADDAMYQAKEGGRNTIVFFHEAHTKLSTIIE